MQRLDADSLAPLLRRAALLGAHESPTLEEAGDGNINWVRRVRLDGGRTFIVKHARDTLERFPSTPPIRSACASKRPTWRRRGRWTSTPFCRACCTSTPPTTSWSSRISAPRRVWMRRCCAATTTGAPLATLARFLGRVHAATAGRDLQARFANEQMRRLHGDHIFHLPFRPNDFPLAPPLRAAAESLWNDGELRRIADAAYARYLEPRGALVHADVQGSNVLLAADGPKLLDAEIAHVGDPAFDTGTLIAHVRLPALARGQEEAARRTIAAVWRAYAEAHAGAVPAFAAAARYAGIEMLRRTIGAARAAATAAADDAAALAILARAVEWIRDPPPSPD